MPEEKSICPPFIRHGEKSRTVMLDVLLALLPALIWSIYIFGARAAVLCAVGIAFAVAAEFCCDLIARQRRSVVDFSAAVTGLLIAFGLPVTAPLWMPALLSVFAIVFVKKLCGGIGRNMFNPAAAALCLAHTVFPETMEKFTRPFAYFSSYILKPTEASIATARVNTALDKLADGSVDIPNLWNEFYGISAGKLGEISVLMLLLGYLYLAFRKNIKPLPPLLYVATVFIVTFFFANGDSEPIYFALMHIFTGSVFLSAIFMCSDYTTTPYTKIGGAVFAVGSALLTVLLRYFGDYGASAYFAILLMNALTPVIEKYTLTMPFGRAGMAIKKKHRKGGARG